MLVKKNSISLRKILKQKKIFKKETIYVVNTLQAFEKDHLYYYGIPINISKEYKRVNSDYYIECMRDTNSVQSFSLEICGVKDINLIDIKDVSQNRDGFFLYKECAVNQDLILVLIDIVNHKKRSHLLVYVFFRKNKFYKLSIEKIVN